MTPKPAMAGFDLGPLLRAPLLVQIHALAAIGAFGLGATQLILPKGGIRHRATGYGWIALMLLVTIGSFGIRSLSHGQSFSPIHLLSIGTLIAMGIAIRAARRGNIRGHGIAMISIFVGALVIAGLFTLTPGRVMYDVVFGAP